MYTNQIALISQSGQITSSEVSKISAAIQKQITRDFTPIWNIKSSIDAFEKLEDVPAGYWPIIIKDDIGYDGAAGIHLDKNGQPYALVQAGQLTPLTCSHECLEMLVDPFGSRLISSDSIIEEQGRVNYLLEVCDPSESERFGYSVNGILLSDFYTPNYFDPIPSKSVRYSFTDSIKKPKQVLKDGYLSWMIPETNEWWQAVFFGTTIDFRNLGVLERKSSQSWREKIDTITIEPNRKIAKRVLSKNKKVESKNLFASLIIENSSNSWAKNLQEDIGNVINSTKNI